MSFTYQIKYNGLEIDWFAYCFPNRRSNETLVEVTLDFSPEAQPLYPQQTTEIRDILISSGILTAEQAFPAQSLPHDAQDRFASLLAQTALLLQNKAGHRVSFFSVTAGSTASQRTILLEHTHCDVGMTAVKLAIELVTGKRKLLAEPFQLFNAFARERIVPADTQAVIAAAQRRDVPTLRMEHQPYNHQRTGFQDITGGICIRQNGLLMLGHGANQHVLDGMFCLDRMAKFKHLLTDRQARLAMLENIGLPLVKGDSHRHGKTGRIQILAVNGEIITGIQQAGSSWLQPSDMPESALSNVRKISQAIECAPVVVTLTQNDAAIVDFDLAPELDRYLNPESAGPGGIYLEAAAEKIIDWLFTGQAQARMPVIAITGTNGKTTTTRMINHVLKHAGHNPGMTCTDGVYINGQQIVEGDHSADAGHLKVLTHKDVDIAVLETHHAGILCRGFAFGWCDIGICLNVSEDHLGDAHTDTVEKMAQVKQALPERARRAAVLFADDPNCLTMLDSIKAQIICLVSMTYDVKKLQTLVGEKPACFSVLETINNAEWMVIYDNGNRYPVIDVCSIPATFGGSARFNVSNAMHAAAACHLSGIDIKTISKSLNGFNSSYDATPGRQNIFDDLPFRVIMDFAHNPDGMNKLAQFTDQQQVSGRKIVAFAGTANRSDETLKKLSRALAGHFDFYFCKEYVPSKAGDHRDVAPILQAALIEAGIDKDRIRVTTNGKDVIFDIFDFCQPGDLLVMLLGHIEKHQLPGYIKEYAAR